MPDARPYSDREREEAAAMRAAAERLYQVPGIPRPIAAALAHTLHAAATELDNGRVLPTEVRRAARHVLQALGDVEAGRGLG